MIDLNPGDYFKRSYEGNGNYLYFGQIIERLHEKAYKVIFSFGHLYSIEMMIVYIHDDENWTKLTKKQMEHEIKLHKIGNFV